MICTSFSSWAVAFWIGLATIAAAQSATIYPDSLFSEGSQDPMNSPIELDTAQFKVVLQLLQARPTRKYADLPITEYDAGYGLWIRPHVA